MYIHVFLEITKTYNFKFFYIIAARAESTITTSKLQKFTEFNLMTNLLSN